MHESFRVLAYLRQWESGLKIVFDFVAERLLLRHQDNSQLISVRRTWSSLNY